MWIKSQTKNMIVNSEQMIDIFIDKSGNRIMCETTRDGDFYVLGEYKDRDTCLKILDALISVIGHDECVYINMPLGGEVDSWYEDMTEINNKLY